VGNDARRRGVVLCLAGPDGAGKSTLATRLADELRARSVEVRHAYWRPGLLPMPGRLVGNPAPGLVTDPQGRPPHGRLKATARLLHYFVDFVLGHWLIYEPIRRRRGVVIVERGWQDLLVDRRRYLMPFRLPITLLSPLVPKPDVIVLLSAPADELYTRKQELAPIEIERQLSVWKQTARARGAVVELDARSSPDDLVQRLLRLVLPRSVPPAEPEQTRRRVLLSCYAIEAGKGSESGSGYNFASRLANRGYDLTLVTRRNNAARLLTDPVFAGVDVVGYDPPRLLTFWKRGSRGVIPYYYAWQLGVGRLARGLHDEEPFDVLHNYNFHTDWAPHFLRARDARVIWGPICHQPRVPRSYLRLEPVRGPLREWAKSVTKHAFWLVDPSLRRAISRSDVIVYANSDLARPFAGARDHIQFENFGGASFDAVEGERPDGPLRLLHVGRAVSIKGGLVAVDALAAAAARGSKASLTLVGDGPLRLRLERYADGLGLAERVRFVPRLGHGDMPVAYAAADAFLYPSLGNQDTVVAEALAAALPVICLQDSGAASMAGEAGLSVSTASYGETVSSLADRILELESAKLDGSLHDLRRAASERARTVSWDGTAARILSAYEGSLRGGRAHADAVRVTAAGTLR
jgi:glycosyltransferase involved in cell wall biosynthesis/thymidylate kinase